MAKWRVTPRTVNNSMTGQIDYDESGARWQVYQDERPYLEQAKQDREAAKKKTDKGYQKFATIPEIVAIEINDKHGIDIHDASFMHDIDKKAKFMTIIKQEFPYLLSY